MEHAQGILAKRTTGCDPRLYVWNLVHYAETHLIPAATPYGREGISVEEFMMEWLRQLSAENPMWETPLESALDAKEKQVYGKIIAIAVSPCAYVTRDARVTGGVAIMNVVRV